MAELNKAYDSSFDFCVCARRCTFCHRVIECVLGVESLFISVCYSRPLYREQLQELPRSVYVERVVECIRFVWRWLYVRCLVQIAFLNLVILQTTYLGFALITESPFFALITESTLYRVRHFLQHQMTPLFAR